MKLAAFTLLAALAAAPFAQTVECVPECCRAADGSTMASCPMRASSSGDCQIRECSTEGVATAVSTLHPAVLAPAAASLTLLPFGAGPALAPARTLATGRDPLIPPPRS